MTYDEYLNTIANSEVEDWDYDDNDGSYVYLNDISITMQRVYEDEREEFYESWVENFPNPNAHRLVINFLYNGALVGKFYTVSVDGYRMNIPFTEAGTTTIAERNYRIGRIINKQECAVINQYDDYIRQARLTIGN